MSRLLYTLVLALYLPVALGRMAVRGVRNRGYWHHLAERFGLLPAGATDTWVHAVSVGEVVAARPLVDALVGRGEQVFVSTGTPTGRARAEALFSQRAQVGFMPFDLPPLLALGLRRRQPRQLVLMETELWPNLVAACAWRRIPVVLGNARLSERSARGYGRFGALTRAMLGRLHAIAAQGEADAQRLVALGASPSTTTVTGSTKFDVLPTDADRTVGDEVRALFGVSAPVLIAASTHPGEDEPVLAAFGKLREAHPRLRLLLVPRHPERFALVAGLARQRGWQVALRSEWPRNVAGADVLIGNTMGELMALYAAADVALVCGSLQPVGGHNPIEPASLGLPILVGPHTFNFADITERLAACGALRVIAHSEAGLVSAVDALLRDAGTRRTMGDAGKLFAGGGGGATQRLLALLPLQRRPEQ